MALPNGPMEIVFSFDTTGSMSGCINEVKGYVQDMVQRLQADIPGIRIAILAHGDYCDKAIYVTKYQDFTDDVPKLCDFTKNVQGTGGGDSDECYELALYQVRTELSWTAGSQRALVMIGDCCPHGVNYPQNTLKLDWKKEADALGAEGVRIYAVQCNSYGGADDFYKTIAQKTAGHHLKLSEFRNIFDFIMAICYREKGGEFLDNYEKEVRARCAGAVNKDLHQLFGDLRDSSPGGSTPTPVKARKSPAKAAKATAAKVAKPKVAMKKIPSATKPLKLTKTAASRKLKRPAVPTALKAFTLEKLPRLRRENVPECNFMLNDLSWSTWQLAMKPTPGNSVWQKRNGDGCGFKTRRIFGGKTNIPALYEIGVQTTYRSRKHVVYSKCCNGFLSSSGSWEKKLLGKSDIKKEIDHVLKHECSVFIRRVAIRGKRVDDKIKPAMCRYDYAWSGVPSVRKGHRNVVRGSTRADGSVNISSCSSMEL